ncbi:hypothetical protein L1887_53979 [Cichorium endivia]|nr:hypothetical protein L1887_53979 [Cichorium endivia]
MGADEVRVRMISALELQEESVFSRQRTSRQTETEPETEGGKKKEEEEKPRSSGLKLKSTHNAQRTAWVSSLLEVQCHQALPVAEERKAVPLHLGVRCIRIDIGTRSDREREQVCVRIACGAFACRFVRMCRGGVGASAKKKPAQQRMHRGRTERGTVEAFLFVARVKQTQAARMAL